MSNIAYELSSSFAESAIESMEFTVQNQRILIEKHKSFCNREGLLVEDMAMIGIAIAENEKHLKVLEKHLQGQRVCLAGIQEDLRDDS